MGLLEDVMKALDRIPVWRRLQGVPDRLDGIERRLAGLEAKLNQPLSQDACPRCGERAFFVAESKLDKTFGRLGHMRRTYRCNNCGFEEEGLAKPAT